MGNLFQRGDNNLYTTNSKATSSSRVIYSGQLRMSTRRTRRGGGDLCFIDGLILNDLSTTCQNLSVYVEEGEDSLVNLDSLL